MKAFLWLLACAAYLYGGIFIGVRMSHEREITLRQIALDADHQLGEMTLEMRAMQAEHDREVGRLHERIIALESSAQIK